MFPNWFEISRIPDRHIRTGVALIDLESEYGKVIMTKFPECFQAEKSENSGPVPLSVLIERARLNRDSPDSDFARHLVCYDGANDIPWIGFCICTECDWYPDLPHELWEHIQVAKRANTLYVGDSFIWEGKELVLLEMGNCGEGGSDCEYFFAPAAAVLVDIKVHYDDPNYKRNQEDMKDWNAEQESKSIYPERHEHREWWWKNDFPKLSREEQEAAIRKVTESTCVFCRRAFFLGFDG